MATRHVHDQLQEFLRYLNSEKVEYLIVGGYAVNIHGYSRLTDDIDVWVAVSEENADRLMSVMQRFFGTTPQRAVFTTPGKILECGHPPTRVHIMTKISGVDFAECFERRHPAKLGDVPTNFIGLEDLKRNKRASGRLKDLADLEEL